MELSRITLNFLNNGVNEVSEAGWSSSGSRLLAWLMASRSILKFIAARWAALREMSLLTRVLVDPTFSMKVS